jgi:hypothetical protein
MNKIILFSLVLSISLLFQSCDKEDDQPPVTTLAIGDFHEGGIIFYLDSTGEHGLVCALTDQSFEAEWGCPPSVVAGAMGIIIGTGQQNTLDILNTCNNAGIAADLCDELNSNGFTDWYLPSKDELNEIYVNLMAVNMGLNDNGGFAMEDTEYWSSSLETSNTAWRQSFNAGNQSGALENDLNNVRAIRNF